MSLQQPVGDNPYQAMPNPLFGALLGGVGGLSVGANLKSEDPNAAYNKAILLAIIGAGVGGAAGIGYNKYNDRHPRRMTHKDTLKTASVALSMLPTTIGAARGYKTAPDDNKTEGAVRGGIEGTGAMAGGMLGGTAGMAIGNTIAGAGSRSQRAFVAILGALAGIGAGGYAGYGLSKGMLGKPSWEGSKATLDPSAVPSEYSDEDREIDDDGTAAKSASVILGMAFNIIR